MKIAQIAPLIERIPPKRYGGTERVVSALTEELVKRGHQVTLFATGDSLTSAELVSVYPKSLREAKLKDVYGLNIWTLLNIAIAYERQEEFDIIHDHNDYVSLPVANIATTPTVMTMHGVFSRENRIIFQKLNRPHLVTISKSQSEIAPDFHYAGMIPNGLAMDHYPFSNQHDGYLLYVGRISLEKGVHVAVEVARILQLPLILAAKLEPANLSYFKEYIEPSLNGQIQWIGEVSEGQRNQLYSRAMAFLHPVTWREPFGLTLIEAMACGCPVIAFNKGSIPEIVINGVTGFVVNDGEEMLNAVMQIGSIERATCREHVLKNFNAKKMAEGYEKIYEKILRENAESMERIAQF